MKGHKFLVLLADSSDLVHELRDNYHTKELAEAIFYTEDQAMHVVTCRHEKMEDNLVTVEAEYGPTEVVRGIDGRFYWCWDWWSKEKVINEFE